MCDVVSHMSATRASNFSLPSVSKALTDKERTLRTLRSWWRPWKIGCRVYVMRHHLSWNSLALRHAWRHGFGVVWTRYLFGDTIAHECVELALVDHFVPVLKTCLKGSVIFTPSKRWRRCPRSPIYVHVFLLEDNLSELCIYHLFFFYWCTFKYWQVAVSTVDRPYPWLIDHLHHHIGTTHVLHHVNSKIPHYHAVEYTKKLSKAIGECYLYDPTPLTCAIWNTASKCIYMSSSKGVQLYQN